MDFAFCNDKSSRVFDIIMDKIFDYEGIRDEEERFYEAMYENDCRPDWDEWFNNCHNDIYYQFLLLKYRGDEVVIKSILVGSWKDYREVSHEYVCHICFKGTDDNEQVTFQDDHVYCFNCAPEDKNDEPVEEEKEENDNKEIIRIRVKKLNILGVLYYFNIISGEVYEPNTKENIGYYNEKTRELKLYDLK